MNKIKVVDDNLASVNINKEIHVEYYEKECMFGINEIKIVVTHSTDLEILINSINNLRIKYIEDEDKTLLKENLIEISKVNIQISTLINYLNNARVSIGKTKINRFEEMQIIEENELKRNIFRYSLETRGTAELKKLRDDIEILQEKSPSIYGFAG